MKDSSSISVVVGNGDEAVQTKADVAKDKDKDGNETSCHHNITGGKGGDVVLGNVKM